MHVKLGAKREVEPLLGNGWSPEPGHIWAVGLESWLLLPLRAGTRNAYLSFQAWPLIRPGRIDSQRLVIHANGYAVGEANLSTRQTIGIPLPRHVVAGKTALCIRLLHPDAARPIDFPEDDNRDSRLLSLAYEELRLEEFDEEEAALSEAIDKALSAPHRPPLHRPVTAMDEAAAGNRAADFLQHFQSAGEDCEFGFLQRSSGIEPLGLLRFASISIDNLSRGLRCGFVDLARPDRVEVFVPPDAPGHDYMVRETTYGMLYHTGVQPDAIAASALKDKEIIRLRRLAVKLLEDMAAGEHIFVVKYKDPPTSFQLARLMAAMRGLGPSTLFWVREASGARPPGTAEWLIPGLIAGYIDRIDVPPLRNISEQSWLLACRAAFRLWRNHPAV